MVQIEAFGNRAKEARMTSDDDGGSDGSVEYTLRAGKSVAELQRASEEIWSEMKKPGSLAHASALEAGYDPAALPRDVSSLVSISSGAPLDPASIGVLVGAVGVVGHDIWKRVLLPRIEERWGKGAIERKRAAEKAEQAAAKSAKKASAKKPKQ
ncbi:MAG TPA: hypothetical protein VLD35_17175 [Caldimonas sp.]|nr:hypothetical protein [Caldimonas sp.]